MQPLDPFWWESWDVVETEVFEDVRAEAWDLHQAERASVTLVDRIRQDTCLLLRDDQRIQVDQVREKLRGSVVVLAQGRVAMVFDRAIVEAENLAPRLAAELPVHATVGSWLRSRAGHFVRVDVVGRPSMWGSLGVMSKDHIDVHGEDGRIRSIPLHVITCVWLCAHPN